MIDLTTILWWLIACFSNQHRELLKGPLFYVLALLISAVFFWRESPIGMISLAMMCGGDGKVSYLLIPSSGYTLASIYSRWHESVLSAIHQYVFVGIADIMGRKFGSAKIPYYPRKSWAGSISMFIFGFFISIGYKTPPLIIWMLCSWWWTTLKNWDDFATKPNRFLLLFCRLLYYYSSLGYLNMIWETTFQRVAMVSMVATVVESLPITDQLDDNVSVPLATILAAYLSFGY